MARSYDAQLGRWMQPDPMMQHASPYLAMSNNPTIFTDPLGLSDQDHIGRDWLTGQVVVRTAAPGKDQYYWLNRTADGDWESLGESPILHARFGGGGIEAGQDHANYFEAVWDKQIRYSASVLARNAQLDRDDANRRSLEQDQRRNLADFSTWKGLGNILLFGSADGKSPEGQVNVSIEINPLSSIIGGGAAKTGANLSINGVKLAKQLASEAQMAEKGLTIIGPGKLKEAARLAKQYGGNAVDWVKKSSSSFTKNGVTFETHWYENILTGVRTEFKTKFPKP